MRTQVIKKHIKNAPVPQKEKNSLPWTANTTYYILTMRSLL